MVRKRAAGKVREHRSDAVDSKQITKLGIRKAEDVQHGRPKKPPGMKRQTENHFAGDNQRDDNQDAAQVCKTVCGAWDSPYHLAELVDPQYT